MRIFIATLIALGLSGCATLPRSGPPSFDDAVLASIDQGDSKPRVVIDMNKKGEMSISGRPVTIDDLTRLRSVAGLPSNPPAILIRADQEVSRPDLDRVMHALGAADMWSIRVSVPKETKPMHNPTSESIRHPADGSPKPSM